MLKRILGKNRYKKIDYQDNFIKRIRSSVIGEGMLHEGNIFLMDYAIKNMPTNGKVLEIGCYGGLSSNLLLHLMKKYNRKEAFMACDPWIYEGYDDAKGQATKTIDGRADVTRTDYMEYMKQAYINAARLLHPTNLPHTFRYTSDGFFSHYQKESNLTDIFGNQLQLGGAISFCYIDGNHAYDFAKRDFENVSQYLLKDGFILFDDSIDGSSFGSAKLMEELKKDNRYKVIYKNPNYLVQRKGS